MFNIKLLLLGPRESGKTVLANFLSDATEAIGGDYSPTQGVRILEYECPNVIANGKNIGCEVELWDCSGDQKRAVDFRNSVLQRVRAQHLNKLTLIHSNLEDDPEQVRTAFRQFLGAVVSSLSESRDKEEMSIIT
ncbi:intraflagellar transport protein 22 homolog isoform X6 [Chiloscyllium plagiosum]|uniref:intraflagellar transport protein 22 homolog isoform X6 n=1 Tax=Chiloscyllium plagiosum TaxID=36176 RepID=UPI001CB82A20|nr:intraflagellar transport protein 22 homolog isoform X6 [Chiloscyllium plagiosum]